MATNGASQNYPFMEFPLSMSRQNAFPLDRSSVFYSLADAKTYAAQDPTAYTGQYISVVVDGVSTAYQIKNESGELEVLGGTTATDEEVQEMLDEVFCGSGTQSEV